jgi:hypothetical protein
MFLERSSIFHFMETWVGSAMRNISLTKSITWMHLIHLEGKLLRGTHGLSRDKISAYHGEGMRTGVQRALGYR